MQIIRQKIPCQRTVRRRVPAWYYLGMFCPLGEMAARMLALRIIAAIILAIWLLLVIIGKGGFVHLLLLNGLGLAVTDLMTVLRTRMRRAAS